MVRSVLFSWRCLKPHIKWNSTVEYRYSTTELLTHGVLLLGAYPVLHKR
jgi:hypothetical protein